MTMPQPRDLRGMSDEEYGRILQDAQDWQYLEVLAGRMATKTRTENYLIPKYNLTREAAHAICNAVESSPNVFTTGGHEVTWVARRPAPRREVS